MTQVANFDDAANASAAPSAGATSGAPLRVVITGASSGIGEAVAERFREAGELHRVLLTGRRAEAPGSLRDGERYLSGDLDDETLVRELIEAAASEFGEIDALVLCHGLQKRMRRSLRWQSPMRRRCSMPTC